MDANVKLISSKKSLINADIQLISSTLMRFKPFMDANPKLMFINKIESPRMLV